MINSFDVIKWIDEIVSGEREQQKKIEAQPECVINLIKIDIDIINA